MTENGARATGAPDPDEMVPTGAEAGPAAEEVADDQQALAKEAAEMRDRWMRALAEMENLRRRTEREVADARSYGISGFARDVLSVADNLRRALDALPAELRAGGDAAVMALVEGIDLTDRELAKALEKHGVRKVEAKGQKFDPNVHQAMFEVPDPSVPNGTVTQVVQDGYMIGERVLRPALVGVAKGGPKAPANDDKAAKQPEG